jgi:hypothetical protein
MDGEVAEIAGQQCLIIDGHGPSLRDAEGARQLIEAAMNAGTRVVALPVERLDAAFFTLSSGLAGEVMQKAVNYGLTLAIIGDIAQHMEASGALRALVAETERGGSVLFVRDREALAGRLAEARNPSR